MTSLAPGDIVTTHRPGIWQVLALDGARASIVKILDEHFQAPPSIHRQSPRRAQAPISSCRPVTRPTLDRLVERIAILARRLPR